MAAVKKGKSKSQPILPAQLRSTFAWLWGPGRPWFLLAVILGLFFGLWHAAWQWVRQQVLAQDEYRVTWEDVETTPLPEWIHNDLRAEVFRDASLDNPQRPLSLMDDDLVERIREAFSLHPWVAKVQHVEKLYPARVKVDLAFRRPVCMVEVMGELLPVDVEGVVLPGQDFSSVEFGRYPRLAGIESRPLGTVGSRWGDGRVVGGAEIASVLLEKWEKFDLARIEPAKTTVAAREEEQTYELFTRKGTRILWGHAPGSSPPGEATGPEKAARLERYLVEHGTLESPSGPQQLDVLRPGSMEAP